jgi:hypothetical protein
LTGTAAGLIGFWNEGVWNLVKGREGMLLILIRTLSGYIFMGLCRCSLFIALQYRKFAEGAVYYGKIMLQEIQQLT